MKCFLMLCLMSLLAVSSADDEEAPFRGCRTYINGRCVGECPEGTHTYSSACGQKHPEPTCDQPNPVPEEGRLCDFFACYCNPPTVRDTKNDRCVPIEQCPKKE